MRRQLEETGDPFLIADPSRGSGVLSAGIDGAEGRVGGVGWVGALGPLRAREAPALCAGDRPDRASGSARPAPPTRLGRPRAARWRSGTAHRCPAAAPATWPGMSLPAPAPVSDRAGPEAIA